MDLKTFERPTPYLQKDIQCLESVQHSATKLVNGFKKLSYEQRLIRLGLTTLEVRRKRGDLIECYKILTDKEILCSSSIFQTSSMTCAVTGSS